MSDQTTGNKNIDDAIALYKSTFNMPDTKHDFKATPIWKAALELVELGLSENKRNLAGWNLKGRLLVELGNYKEAAEAWEKALELLKDSTSEEFIRTANNLEFAYRCCGMSKAVAKIKADVRRKLASGDGINKWAYFMLGYK